jgi:acetoacetyl-CoA synthetase
MPGAQWFPGTLVNYAEHAFRGKDHDAIAIVAGGERRDDEEWTWGALHEQTRRIAAGLLALGVGRGDRVAAYMPNIPETAAAFLATASLGAVWSSCSPDFGARSVIDRFAQIEPKVLLAVDGYRYNGRDFDRRDVVRELRDAMPGLAATVLLPYGNEDARLEGALDWDDLGGGDEELRFERVPFDHPLWVLYSSGTTGLPKAIVHSQGGILLEHLKKLHLHLDAQAGDRLFWFTTTGWMMWNFIISGLLTDAAILLWDGSPGHPDMGVLWDFADRTGMTTFGTSASYIGACMKAGLEPGAGRDLSALRSVGSTGSPLSPEGFRWVYEHLGADTWLFSTSGGTDMCTAFVGGTPLLPVYEGELQARALGASVESWDPEGRPLIGEVGELVVTKPMPSMPIHFWNDEDGERYRDAYFSVYPGIWRHGDWIEITERGTAIISGRSDATINRGGIRMGTAEIYRAVLTVEAVTDALVVDVPQEDGDAWMPLFVVMREGAELTDEIVAEIRKRIREDCSPRHVPNDVIAVHEVPRTLSGKLLELPVKRILMGTPVEKAAARDSLANPHALDAFVDFARSRA